MRLFFTRVAFALMIAATAYAPSSAGVVTFGSGANQFNMEFVTIGNPGNAADTTGDPNPAGAVAYEYGIGKFEVSEDMIEKFNASQSLQIIKDTRGTAKPATNITWNEAARFVNWLNTSTGNQAAYKFFYGDVNDNIELWTPGEAGYDASNPMRNSLAKYFLPTTDEWYKAAYYNPTNSTYYDYATGSNTAPTAVASGTSAGTAVYNVQPSPANVNQAGGLSPYGVMGQSGNVFEWQESYTSLGNSNRIIRGGGWEYGDSFMMSATRYDLAPFLEYNSLGFRVASLAPSSPVP
ncbi:MAG: hypothetical protein RL240_897, partial [Planctomycetota bacterium]